MTSINTRLIAIRALWSLIWNPPSEEPNSDNPKHSTYISLIGIETESPGGDYLMVYQYGHVQNGIWLNGGVSLIQGRNLIYRIPFGKVHDARISKDGIVACTFYEVVDNRIHELIILDRLGKPIYRQVIPGATKSFDFSDDGLTLHYETWGVSKKKNEVEQTVFSFPIPAVL